MQPPNQTSRRRFLQTSAVLTAAAQPLLVGSALGATRVGKAKIRKTLKIGMVGGDAPLTEKFKVAKAAGFDGIEMNSPGKYSPKQIKQAIEESGLPVDGTVISSHWQIRHTSPKRDDREKALEHLQIALRETKAIGGDTALLVVGHGQDGDEETIWRRALVNIAKAVPLAEKLQIHIAIENVWNQFLYNHKGDSNQTADKFVQFVDELDSPYVGMQFDIGNHWKYGSMGDWIRTLDKRIVKLDLKGFSREQDKFTKIGEGDIDWADVRKALDEIAFDGWAAAEVRGGGPQRLAEISANMDKVFALNRKAD